MDLQWIHGIRLSRCVTLLSVWFVLCTRFSTAELSEKLSPKVVTSSKPILSIPSSKPIMTPVLNQRNAPLISPIPTLANVDFVRDTQATESHSSKSRTDVVDSGVSSVVNFLYVVVGIVVVAAFASFGCSYVKRSQVNYAPVYAGGDDNDDVSDICSGTGETEMSKLPL